MGIARVSSIVRYPVKGLPGIPAASTVELLPGRGLRWDRSHAIQNGVNAPHSDTGWNPRETYFHVAKNEQLVRLGIALESAESANPVLRLTLPDGRDATLRLGEETLESHAMDALLSDALPSGPLGPPTLTRTSGGLWDWPAAHLSIINLATLDALEIASDHPVDPRRFRGNLYLDGLPAWGEFALLGRRVRIGEAVLELFQPTDRCRATTIDPITGVSDLNVPALLAGRFGHMFCGLYARVVDGGGIAPGDELQVVGDADPKPAGSREWPRTGRVLDRVAESPSVVSFWLDDPLGLLPHAAAGQHVRIHVPGVEVPAWRCYTISGVEPGRFRISVRRDGRISRLLHESIRAGSELVLTGPFGDVTLEDEPDDTGGVLLLSAGVGVTPTVAMLRALAGTRRPVRVVHTERSGDDLSLWHEVVALCAALPDARAQLHLSRENEDRAAKLGAIAGRPTDAHLAAALADLSGPNESRLGTVSGYACGPGGFPTELRGRLSTLGLPPDRFAYEVFFSPTTAALAPARTPSTTGPHRLRFGEEETTWTPQSGSILDAVEAGGTDWPSGCRVGVCGTCARLLRSGTVEYLAEPLTPPAVGTVLVCCTAPTSDLVLQPPT
jgi:ferredoxin-NADP reductase